LLSVGSRLRRAEGGTVNAALELRELSTFYGEAQVLFGASLSIAGGEVVALVGRNGAGKTSLLRAAMGLMPRTTGQVLLDGADVGRLPPFRRARSGLGYVPEDRRIFSDLSVAENLRIAARPVENGFTERDLLELFPNLAAMLERPASAMSGGEQQMLAVARTLATNPRVVLLDEPSEGIAPMIVGRMRDAVRAMKRRGVGILVSEQNLRFVASIADRAVLIEQGHLTGEAGRDDLIEPSAALRRVLGV
jgi:branched-chain amino acid transport system ATP-binding protein